MKKGVIISLIVAAALIVSGGVLFYFGLQNIEHDVSSEPVNELYTAAGSFQSIQIDANICDVCFFQTDADLTVHCPQFEALEWIVTVEDGVLRITAEDHRMWYDFIGISLDSPQLAVYLPEESYESLHIQTDTGDITVSADFSFDTARLLTATGDIDFAAAVKETLVTRNSTGETQIYGICPADLECSSTTGEIELENLQVSGAVHIQRSTGKLCVENTTCKSLTTQSDTGNTRLKNVLVEEQLQITASTGRVTLEDCDAGTVYIETSTGDVTGNFISPKWFIAETDTGDISVPLSREGGECRITTDTGDIRFS